MRVQSENWIDSDFSVWRKEGYKVHLDDRHELEDIAKLSDGTYVYTMRNRQQVYKIGANPGYSQNATTIYTIPNIWSPLFKGSALGLGSPNVYYDMIGRNAVSGDFFGKWKAIVGDKLFFVVYQHDTSYPTPHTYTDGIAVAILCMVDLITQDDPVGILQFDTFGGYGGGWSSVAGVTKSCDISYDVVTDRVCVAFAIESVVTQLSPTPNDVVKFCWFGSCSSTGGTPGTLNLYSTNNQSGGSSKCSVVCASHNGSSYASHWSNLGTYSNSFLNRWVIANDSTPSITTTISDAINYDHEIGSIDWNVVSWGPERSGPWGLNYTVSTLLTGGSTVTIYNVDRTESWIDPRGVEETYNLGIRYLGAVRLTSAGDYYVLCVNNDGNPSIIRLHAGGTTVTSIGIDTTSQVSTFQTDVNSSSRSASINYTSTKVPAVDTDADLLWLRVNGWRVSSGTHQKVVLYERPSLDVS